jgi:hypothetical protein
VACNASTFSGTPLAIEPSPGPLSSDAGPLPVRQLDQRIGLTRPFADALDHPRHPGLSEHTFREIVRSRVYGILAGYEVQNDHGTLGIGLASNWSRAARRTLATGQVPRSSHPSPCRGNGKALADVDLTRSGPAHRVEFVWRCSELRSHRPTYQTEGEARQSLQPAVAVFRSLGVVPDLQQDVGVGQQGAAAAGQPADGYSPALGWCGASGPNGRPVIDDPRRYVPARRGLGVLAAQHGDGAGGAVAVPQPGPGGAAAALNWPETSGGMV